MKTTNGTRVKKLKWQKAGRYCEPGWIFAMSKTGAVALVQAGMSGHTIPCTWDFVQLTIIKETK